MIRVTRVGTILLWLVLTVSIPLLLLAADAVWRIQKSQLQQQQTQLVDLARDASQPVDRWFERLKDGLLALAGSTALSRGELDLFGEEASLMSARLGGIPISLEAFDGKELMQVGGVHLPAPTTLVRQIALTAIRTRAPVITNLLAADDPARRAIEVAVPVDRAGETTAGYVLVGRIDCSRLAQSLPSGPGFVLTILDRNGTTVASSLHADQYVGQPARPGWRRAIANRRFGLLADQGPLQKIPMIRAFSIEPLSSFTVIVAQPRASFTAAIRRDLLQTLLFGAALLSIGLFAAWYLSRRLVGALQALEQRGPAIVPSGLREVDELGVRLRAAWKASEASEARLRDHLGMLDLASIIVREVNGTIRFWSLGCTRLYGWSREEAVGRRCDELLGTQFSAPPGEIEQTLLTRGEWKGDLVHRRRDGSAMITAVHKALRRNGDGHEYMVMESLADVTALRAAEGGLKRLNQELEQRVQTEVGAREAAQRQAEHANRIQALGRLAGGIAHDFNNVLQVIAGGAALIRRHPQDAGAVSRLGQVISDAVVRGASVTRRMLVLAHKEALQVEPIEPAALLTAMREVFKATVGADVDVRLDIAKGLPRLLADKAHLEMALVNLATNARDAMAEGGTLWLSAELEAVMPASAARHPVGLSSGMYVRLSVVDNGIGMSPEALARVGEPFFTTKDVGKGTGLGLPMVKGFADHSGGGFAIESAIGAGTTVTLWLPVVPDDARALAGAAVSEAGLRSKGQILLVDDDSGVRDTLAEQLEELGHKVLAASCGVDALAILRAPQAVDLMITDLSMPGMSGLTLIEQARQLQPSLPAILLTGNPCEITAMETKGCAPSAYLLMRKPATSAMLGARVTTLLERA